MKTPLARSELTSEAFSSARMPMQQAWRAISPWGAMLFLPVKGPRKACFTLEPCDAQNVSLENGAVKLFVQTELGEGYNVPLPIWSMSEMRYNTSPLDWEDHHGNT